jgi:hypothetical protein
MSREIRACLKELRDLRKDALAADTAEPEPWPENEPGGSLPPANDDAAWVPATEPAADVAMVRNEPEPATWDEADPAARAALIAAVQAEIAAQTAAPEPDPTRLMALTRRLGPEGLRVLAAAREAARQEAWREMRCQAGAAA